MIMATQMKNWDIGDYANHFLHEAENSQEGQFQESFHRLGGELESLDAQFLRENTECTTQIPHLMEELHSLAGRLGYCETDRGFHRDCELLYADVDTVVDEVQSLDRSCFM